jgi:hypothetical protein
MHDIFEQEWSLAQTVKKAEISTSNCMPADLSVGGVTLLSGKASNAAAMAVNDRRRAVLVFGSLIACRIV